MQDAALARCSKPTTGHYSTMLQYPASLEPHMCTAGKHLYKSGVLSADYVPDIV